MLIGLVHTEQLGEARVECEFDQIAEEVGKTAYGSHTDDERDCRKTFPPSGIGKSAVMFVLYGAEEKFADHAEDIYRSDND